MAVENDGLMLSQQMQSHRKKLRIVNVIQITVQLFCLFFDAFGNAGKQQSLPCIMRLISNADHMNIFVLAALSGGNKINLIPCFGK